MHTLIIIKAAGATLETLLPQQETNRHDSGMPAPHSPHPTQIEPEQSDFAVGTILTTFRVLCISPFHRHLLTAVCLLDGEFSLNSIPDFFPIAREGIHLLLSFSKYFLKKALYFFNQI